MIEETIRVGGQAVIEGVMMRTPGAVAVAVRKPNGEISVQTRTIKAPAERHWFWRLPIVRGVLALFQSLTLGIQALNFSANESLEEEGESFGIVALSLTMAVALALGIGIFVYLPLFLTNLLGAFLPPVETSSFVFNLVDGILRVVFFLAYIFGISLIKDLRRVFEYHGAEHKTIYTYEHGDALTPEEANKYSTLHPRCGTNFLLIIMVLSILVFSVLRSDAAFYLKFLSRIVLIPLIAGIGYEVIRFAGKNQDKAWVRWITAPGLSLQKITTKPPSNAQIDVAIRALQEALKLEKEHHAPRTDPYEVVL